MLREYKYFISNMMLLIFNNSYNSYLNQYGKDPDGKDPDKLYNDFINKIFNDSYNSYLNQYGKDPDGKDPDKLYNDFINKIFESAINMSFENNVKYLKKTIQHLLKKLEKDNIRQIVEKNFIKWEKDYIFFNNNIIYLFKYININLSSRIKTVLYIFSYSVSFAILASTCFKQIDFNTYYYILFISILYISLLYFIFSDKKKLNMFFNENGNKSDLFDIYWKYISKDRDSE